MSFEDMWNLEKLTLVAPTGLQVDLDTSFGIHESFGRHGYSFYYGAGKDVYRSQTFVNKNEYKLIATYRKER